MNIRVKYIFIIMQDKQVADEVVKQLTHVNGMLFTILKWAFFKVTIGKHNSISLFKN